MTATLEGSEWSAARSGRTLPLGKTRYPFYRRLGGSQGRSGRAENLVPTGIQSWTVQPVAQSLYRLWRQCRAHIFKGRSVLALPIPLNMMALVCHRCQAYSVVMATRCGLGCTGIESRYGRDFPHPTRPALRLAQLPVQWVQFHCRG